MPAKVQLKLLSNSGELLNVATCCAGKISVLRASTPSDLRPYQRALGGSSAKDNLEIVCDNSTFYPEEHVLIGFGEPSPTTGLTVKEFLTSRGVSEFAIETQLMSIGLEDVLEKRCAELTLDQESRLRLLAATSNPEKILVLNDPFENISAKWRERAAEFLAEFARSRNALIIIPSLTYRPEAWIENECIARIEVGQTSQRTIGFGSAGSENNSQMEDIRNQLRADPRFAGKIGRRGSQTTAALMATGLAPGISPSDLGSAGTAAGSTTSTVATIGKMALTLGVSVAGGWAIYTSMFQLTQQPGTQPASNTVVAGKNENIALPQKQDGSVKPLLANPASLQNESPVQVAALNLANKVAQEPHTEYLLDLYPVAIKESLLDTIRGSINFQDVSELPASSPPSPQEKNSSGNLFSLLEAASDSKEGPSAPQREYRNYDDNASVSAEDAQREKIRERFLEAIRASAARRQAEAEEDW